MNNVKGISGIVDGNDITVIYGAGNMGKKCLSTLKKVDYFCDKNAMNIGEISGIPCILPEQLYDIDGSKNIIISIADESEKQRIRQTLELFVKDACVFDYVDEFRPRNNDVAQNKIDNNLYINIVCNNDGWIFEKFAQNLKKELDGLNQNCVISECERPDADVNHFISYGLLRKVFHDTNTCRTTMITHIDTSRKRDLISFQAKQNSVGICMSTDTRNKLIRWGIPADKLCYVLPPQDGEMKPRKIRLGITNRCYGNNVDYRKRDDLIVKVMENLDCSLFSIWIMGSGWGKYVDELRKMGVEVDWDEDFDRIRYYKKMPLLDYWLYYGFDEGAMGYLDALAAGIKTIATPQGYHLDLSRGLTYPCSTIEEFVNTLKSIQNEKSCITGIVKELTWKNYARKHLEIWQYMTGARPLGEILKHQSEYMDGIFSLLLNSNEVN